jgi:hypothetical protein
MPLLGPKWTKVLKDGRLKLGTSLEELRKRYAYTNVTYKDLSLESPWNALPYATFVRFVKTGHLPAHWKKQLNLVDKITYQRSCNMIDPISTADTLEGYMHATNINKLLAELQSRGYGNEYEHRHEDNRTCLQRENQSRDF